jgi:hypothetical protein
MTEHAITDDYQRLLTDAIHTLTDAAKLNASNAGGNGHGVDVAEFAALALAGAAANVGGINALLAGRPGSWEADAACRLLEGTVGADESALWHHRTEPVQVVVNVDDILDDLGYTRLYEDSARQVEEQAGSSLPANPTDTDLLLVDQRVDERLSQLEAQREAEWAAYGAAFAQAVTDAAPQLLPGLAVPVHVVVNTTYQGSLGSGQEPDGPASRLWDWAWHATPPPGSRTPLREHPPGDVSQHARQVGNLPHQRLNGSQLDQLGPSL